MNNPKLKLPNYAPNSDKEVTLRLHPYGGKSKNLCIDLYIDEQPFCSLTVNLARPLPPYQAYIGDLEWGLDFIEINKLGYYAGKISDQRIGYYPLFKFFPWRLKECCPKDYEKYEEAIQKGVLYYERTN